jgi:hypothetical protein
MVTERGGEGGSYLQHEEHRGKGQIITPLKTPE